MLLHLVTDFDRAYDIRPFVPDGEAYLDRWLDDAAAFRENRHDALDIAYGDHPRQVFDLFLPDDTPKGLLVFVHGGYWVAFDKSSWSHFAAGPLAAGWAVAMPSYPLAP